MEKVLEIMAVFYGLLDDTWEKSPMKNARFLRGFGEKPCILDLNFPTRLSYNSININKLLKIFDFFSRP